MTWKGPLVSLEGAKQIFDGWGMEFSHNPDLDIYEAKPLHGDAIQAKTLVELCQKVVRYLAPA